MPIDPDLKICNLSSSSVLEWVPSVMCLNTNIGKIKNRVNRLAGKSWPLLEKDSGEGELRDLEVTIPPWCEFSPPHHEESSFKAYHESKEDCSSVQEVKEAVHQERVLLPTNWSSGGWKSELPHRPWMIAVQCSFYNYYPYLYLLGKNISSVFVYKPGFLLWKNTRKWNLCRGWPSQTDCNPDEIWRLSKL